MIKIKRLGHLVIRVRNVKRSEEFYSNVLGLEVKGRYDDKMVFFRSNHEVDHDLAIMGIGDDAPGPEATRVGLYHFAYELDSLDDLREAYSSIKEKGVSIAGFGDHGDTKGLYIFDPDGNEIELYAIAPQHEGTPLETLLTEPQASFNA